MALLDDCRLLAARLHLAGRLGETHLESLVRRAEDSARRWEKERAPADGRETESFAPSHRVCVLRHFVLQMIEHFRGDVERALRLPEPQLDALALPISERARPGRNEQFLDPSTWDFDVLDQSPVERDPVTVELAPFVALLATGKWILVQERALTPVSARSASR